MKRAAKPPVEPADDERFAAVVEALASDPRFTEIVEAFTAAKRQPGRKFGSNGLKVNGKIFAMSVRGALVVKLSKERVAQLVDSGAGDYFDRGQGTPMKQWVVIAGAKPSWLALVKEAHDYVQSTR
jgi:hypothetical protein